MNKKIIYGSILMATLLSVACQKNFLNVQTTTPTPSNDPTVAMDLVSGVYSSLIYVDPRGGWNYDTHGISFVAATDIMSDDADKGSYLADQPGVLDLDNFTETAGNSFVAALWNGYYVGIGRVNNALAALAVAKLDTATANRLIAEVRFIRGYYYFNLVRFFGGVPIVITVPNGPKAANSNASYVTRASVTEVYNNVIIPDMQFAMNELPPKAGTSTGRINRGIAEGMLAKVYLYLQNWQMAFSLTQDIINSGQYSLVPDYSTIWRQAGDNNAESIFEIETGGFGGTDAGIPLYSEFQGPRNAGGGWNNPTFPDATGDLGWGFCTPSTSLISAYDSGDLREAASIIFVNPSFAAPTGDTLWDGFVIPKRSSVQALYYNYKAYHSEKLETFYGNRDRKEKNIHLFRFAEVLLINAEAANELGQASTATTDLNQVRTRAGLPNTTAVSQSDIRTAIWNERRVELALEHDRFFDLVRTGRAAQAMTAAGKNFAAGKNELLPIPSVQIALSGGKLTQNPGY